MSDEFGRRHHQNVLDSFGMRKRFGISNIDQMTIARFLNLKQAITFAGADHSNTNGDVKALTQMFSQLFSELDCPRGNQIDVLAHARLINISVDGLRAKNNCIVATAQEFEHGIVNSSQRQPFAHGKLLEDQNSRVETHRKLLCGHLSVAYYRPLHIRSSSLHISSKVTDA